MLSAKVAQGMESRVATLTKEATEKQTDENSPSDVDSSDDKRTLDEIIEVYAK